MIPWVTFPWVTCYLYPLEQSSSLGSCGIRREVGMTQTYPLNFCKSGPAGRLNLSPNLFLPFHMPSVPADTNLEGAIHEVHILADASEQAYGVVAYTRTEDKVGQIHLSFILAHSQVAQDVCIPYHAWSSACSAAGSCPREGTYLDSGSKCVVVRLHYSSNLATLPVFPLQGFLGH